MHIVKISPCSLSDPNQEVNSLYPPFFEEKSPVTQKISSISYTKLKNSHPAQKSSRYGNCCDPEEALSPSNMENNAQTFCNNAKKQNL